MRNTLLTITIAAAATLVGCSSETPGGDAPDAAISAEICDDAIDNNGDGAIDCDDVTCECEPTLCGDGIVDGDEECDSGATAAADCDIDCTRPMCGDGLINRAAGESCDDGNRADGDLCTASCAIDHDQYGLFAVSSQHSCALLEGGAVRCWGASLPLGYQSAEDIGDDELPNSSGPVEIGAEAVQVSAGADHTCALLSIGLPVCWGDGAFGRLGYGNEQIIGDDEAPFTAGVVDVNATAVQISASSAHTCALLTGGSVRCWGNGFWGRLGYGNTEHIGDDETPASVGTVDVGGRVVQLATGAQHTCALLDGGTVRCWGNGQEGRLGYGNILGVGETNTPASVGDVPVGAPVQQITAGFRHTCALLDTGAVRCWGDGTNGQLGYGNTDHVGDDETPASAGDVDIGGPAVQIAGGSLHTCALLETGSVRCWGGGSYRLGYGNTETIGDDEVPATAGDIDIGGVSVQIATRYNHTCALLDTGSIRCWGGNNRGQLGYGHTESIGDDETPASAGDVPYR